MKPHSSSNFVAIACVVGLGLLASQNALAGSSFGWLYYQQGDVTTKVDSVSESKDDYYPAGMDLLAVDQEIYFQIGMDMAGRWMYDVISTFIFWDHYTLHELDYGLDESFCNLKGGVFHNYSTTYGIGYGADLDWRVNRYSAVEGASANSKKIRIGLGPNVGFRISPFSWITVFPNVSGYFYPWPNKDFAFIPKTFDSFGYRAEFPITIDLHDALTKKSDFMVVISAMPFIGSKSGFYNSNDQTGVIKNASASVAGIKFGFYAMY